MDNPLVSIIVPCYNQAQYLPDALTSVLEQTYPSWECIIVNDGSPDNTEEVANDWTAQDNRFKYFKKENGGLPDARNFGISNSTGEYILPLDADDKISAHYLELAIRRFEDFSETKLVYCNAEIFGNRTGKWILPEYEYEKLLFENMIFCSAIFRRCDYNETNGYNTNMINGYEDWDFWLSLIKKNDTIFLLPETCFYYRIKDFSLSTNIKNELRDELLSQLILNHTEKYQKYFPEIIKLKQQENCLQILKLEKEQIERELLMAKNSKAYKIGKMILKPFTKLKSLVYG